MEGSGVEQSTVVIHSLEKFVPPLTFTEGEEEGGEEARLWGQGYRGLSLLCLFSITRLYGRPQVLLACVCSRHEGSLQATARHWQRIWIRTETPKRADARTGRRIPQPLALHMLTCEGRRALYLSRTLFFSFFFDEDPIGLHYLGRS
ncbi:hypothetical protein QQF64_001816 [Cirrhinus molitorella]|uniref:Uncharacterized protein n=1 Tax=Cirrhinus molitorella TaxID=172907 RepID=A0ABR3MND2_9TELE